MAETTETIKKDGIEEKRKDGFKIILRRSLPSSAGKEDLTQPEIKAEAKKENKPVAPIIDRTLEISRAKQILLMWGTENPADIPFGLRQEEDDSDNYTFRRAKEILEGGIDLSMVEVQRPVPESATEAVQDTGYKMWDITHAEGGITVFNELLKRGWKMVDAHWKYTQSQQSKKEGNGKKKHIIVLSLSQEGERLVLPEPTFKGFIRLMHQTWPVKAWDNRHLPQRNIVLNFPFMRYRGTSARERLVLPPIKVEAPKK